MWVYERLYDGVPDAYILVFAHGEMLVLSALILFGISVQVKKLQAEDRRVSRSVKWSARSFGILALLFFDFMKHCVHNNRCFNVTPDQGVLKAYSGFTLAVTLVSITFGYYAYWKVKKIITEG